MGKAAPRIENSHSRGRKVIAELILERVYVVAAADQTNHTVILTGEWHRKLTRHKAQHSHVWVDAHSIFYEDQAIACPCSLVCRGLPQP